MKTKRIIALILALTLIIAIAACGNGGDTTAPTTAPVADDTTPADDTSDDPPPPPPVSDGVELEIFLMSSDWAEGAQAIIDAFMAENPGVTANYASLMGDSCAAALQPMAAAGALPDVMSIDADTFGSMLADEGLLVDLGNYPHIKDRVLPAVVGPYTSEGGIFYGVAGGLASNLIYYNRDLFDEAGVPETDYHPKDWQEFLDLCQTIKDAGIAPLIAPAGMALSVMGNTFWSTGMVTNFTTRGIDYGSQVMDGTFNFNVPEYAAIYERALELQNKDFFISGNIGIDYQQGNDAFVQGEVAMLYGGSWLAGPMFRADFNVGCFTPVLNDPGKPIGVAVGVETGFAAANNENAEWSVRFIDFMTNGEGFYIYQNACGNLSYITDPDPSRLEIEPAVADIMDSAFNDPGIYTGPFWFMILPSEMFNEVPLTFSQMFGGELTPAQAAEAFDNAFKALQ